MNGLVTSLAPMFLLPTVAEEVCQMEEERSTQNRAKRKPTKSPAPDDSCITPDQASLILPFFTLKIHPFEELLPFWLLPSCPVLVLEVEAHQRRGCLLLLRSLCRAWASEESTFLQLWETLPQALGKGVRTARRRMGEQGCQLYLCSGETL